MAPAPPAAPRCKVVGIGASAGGLEAFTDFVRAIPADCQAAFILVQHLDPTHRSLLTELLARSSTLPVREIEHEMKAEPGRIFVIPPNADLELHDGVLHLSLRQKHVGAARSIDHFLSSMASDQKANAIGIILSGAGSDGTRGLKAVKEAGGATFAQDEDSAKYDSMPRSAIAAGAVDYILPPADIAREVARLVAGQKPTVAITVGKTEAVRTHKLQRDGAGEPDLDWEKNKGHLELRKLFLVIREKTGLDFSLYRISTIQRRIQRRMAIVHSKNVEAYCAMLEGNPAEVDALYQDLLIGVTSFFRNPSVFEGLKKAVFPKLIAAQMRNEPLRFWVVGCSTGQEPYSLAMAFTEYCERAKVTPHYQIFASDVNPRALAKGRLGEYSLAQIEGVSERRLKQFFRREGEGYRVNKSLRDHVVFAEQNLLTDPPFTRVDLISCRNMLIYIELALQQRIIPTFHYALKPHGCLLLGTSESVGTFGNLFTAAEERQKLYFKKAGVSTARPPALSFTPKRPVSVVAEPPPREGTATLPEIVQEGERLILNAYAPPGAIVNEAGEVLQVRGKVHPFLEIPAGKATLHIVKMARDGLRIALQRGLRRAAADNREFREKNIRLALAGAPVTLIVTPFERRDTRCFLIIFDQSVESGVESKIRRGRTPAAPEDETKLSTLKRDYAEVRDSLDSLQERHDTAVEELQASNEEVQSTNEELQSLNEELETSNEELESTNEELTTLNEELAGRNRELRESEQRLREQAQLVELAPVIVRSAKERILFWNRGAERLYGFTRDEALGQGYAHLLSPKYPGAPEEIQAAFARDGRWEGEVIVSRKDGTKVNISMQWVADTESAANNGNVLEVHTDITARRKAEESLRQSEALNSRVLESTLDAIAVLDLTGDFKFVNPGARRAFGFDGNGPAPDKWIDLWSRDTRETADGGYRKALLGEVVRFRAATVRHEEGRWYDVVIQPILSEKGSPEAILAICRDVTEQKNAELAAAQEVRVAAMRAEIAVEVARGGELADILRQVAHIILEHADAISVRIWLTEGDPARLVLFTSEGLFALLNGHQANLMVGESRVGVIAASKRPYVTQHVEADGEICDPVWARREGVTAFAGHPLLFESKLLGVIAVMSRTRMGPRLLKEIALSADAVALLVQRKLADEERAQLLQQMTEARNAAVAASRAKDDFLATLSHELRTPLNPVLMLASDVAEDSDMPEKYRTMFAMIRNNVMLEARLIDDLLDITRIARGKLTLDTRPVDLNEVAANAAAIVAKNIANGVRLTTSFKAARSIVIGDAVRLQQVIWNLLNNGVKFSARHDAEVTITTSNPEPGRITVAVEDNGIGLRKDDLSRIFAAFSQVEHGRGGLGLGLAISQQLVERHGGVIRARSDGIGRGSTFEIEFPLAEEPVAAPVASAPPAAVTVPRFKGSAGVRVLLIEDHPSTRDTLQALLKRRGFSVTTAGSAGEVKPLVAAERFDLVISDLGLPDGDGVSLLADIRAALPDVPAIALSGYGTENDLERSKSAGFGFHLTKPVSMGALDAAIAAALAPESAEFVK